MDSPEELCRTTPDALGRFLKVVRENGDTTPSTDGPYLVFVRQDGSVKAACVVERYDDLVALRDLFADAVHRMHAKELEAVQGAHTR